MNNKLKEKNNQIKKDYNKLVDDFNKVYTDKYKSDYKNIIINEQDQKLKEENDALKINFDKVCMLFLTMDELYFLIYRFGYDTK